MRFLRLSFVLACLLFSTNCIVGQSVGGLSWSEDGKQALFQANDKKYLIDIEAGTRQVVDQLPEFAKAIPRLSLPKLNSIDGGDRTNLEVKNESKDTFEIFWVNSSGNQRHYETVKPGSSFTQNTYVGHAWLLKSESGKKLGSFRAVPNEVLVVDAETLGNVVIAKRRRRREATKRFRYVKPSDPPSVEVRDHNLWLEGNQLTTDATEDLTFLNVGSGTSWFKNASRPDLRWSPESKYLVAFQTANVPQTHVQIVQASPSGQLQPKVHRFPYVKPGDELPKKTLRLFSVADQKEISVSNELFENPFSLRFVRWSEDGEKFWLFYNQRGHQVVRLVEVEAKTGTARTLIENTSDAFIHYSNSAKSVFKPLPDDKILWASERSGWNHLYRFDANTGEWVNPITQGDWNVKQINRIDIENEVIWFYAVGIHADQDPYHRHFCRVNFDGSQFKILTDGDGTHSVEFEQDDNFLVDTYSRVDMARVTELRDAETGELVVELDRQDTKEAFGARPLTTRFSAKGRDGETDIWGIIHWPKDFDPEKSYPVVEQIYAGPHDHHVPKSFRKNYYFQHRFADAGMIVVQIDGMGTAWRSKKFHDLCYKNLKDAGFPDRIAWMKAAAKEHPQMDLDRVGIFGGSAGGQNAMAALLWHNDFYKVAAADCGCHDNRMDKIWWNEQWMGWPVDESYVANSNMENAHLLKGHLMLTVGEMDRNVDPATTTQVVKKLIEHNKDFEYLLIPGGGHGSGGSPWAAKKRLEFFKKHLLE